MSTELLAPSSPNSDRTASKIFFLRYTGDTVRSGSDGISLQIEISFAVSYIVDKNFLSMQISQFSALSRSLDNGIETRGSRAYRLCHAVTNRDRIYV